MEKYKVVLATFEDGTTYPEIKDLVNIKDKSDRFMVAPDNFKVGDVINQHEFKTILCNYTDDQGYGKAEFAFELNKTEE